MTFDEYWKALTTKNPKLLEDVVKVKQTGLYNMLKQAFDKGYEHSKVFNKINDALNTSPGSSTNQEHYANFFNDIINGTKYKK